MTPTIPLDAPGTHHGHLRLPHSRDDSAWGHVMIPICVIGGGDGPTVLLTAGTHGDEYEGPLALHALAATLEARAVAGRIVIVPQLNTPAVHAATRTSPVDGGNLNRVFPGDPRGTVTQRIAHLVAATLIPMADTVIDLHSGGKTLEFLPMACSHVLPDPAHDAACAAAARAFAAPYTLRMLEIDDTGMLDGAAERAGKTFVTTELGGAGTAHPATVRIARDGVRRVLHHLGVLDAAPPPAPGRLLDMPDASCFAIAEAAGMVEYLEEPGARVAAGQPLARVWPLARTGLPASDIAAGRDGLLVARHVPGLIKPGDCAAVVAVPLDD